MIKADAVLTINHGKPQCSREQQRACVDSVFLQIQNSNRDRLG